MKDTAPLSADMQRMASGLLETAEFFAESGEPQRVVDTLAILRDLTRVGLVRTAGDNPEACQHPVATAIIDLVVLAANAMQAKLLLLANEVKAAREAHCQEG